MFYPGSNSGGSQNLWNTNQKFSIVDQALNIVFKDSSKIDTFLDIGCNLGMYVFLSSLKFNIPKSYVIDYNSNYLKCCSDIANTIGVQDKVEFANRSFSDIKEQYDIVLAMGLIHHLYSRTESYGNLELIVNHFRSITSKYLIIEFPTESDNKASKWIKLQGRNTDDDYTVANFEKYLRVYFSTFTIIGSVSTSRPTYLCRV